MRRQESLPAAFCLGDFNSFAIDFVGHSACGVTINSGRLVVGRKPRDFDTYKLSKPKFRTNFLAISNVLR
jgi:hypothetical protein